jgi:hypothetical protein
LAREPGYMGWRGRFRAADPCLTQPTTQRVSEGRGELRAHHTLHVGSGAPSSRDRTYSEELRSDTTGSMICGMAMNKTIPKNIDDYVDRFPDEVQQLLRKMRLTIRKAAPQAKETISYRIPTFTLETDIWSISRRTNTTLGSTRLLPRPRRLRRSYRHIKEPRGPYNSRSTSRCLWLW